AHDLGARLGCGAHLVRLVRTASGGFTLDDAHPPDDLVARASEGTLADLLLAPDRAVERRPAAIVSSPVADSLRAGRDVRLDGGQAVPLCRAYSTEGGFLGMLSAREDGLWHPQKAVGVT